MFEKSRADFELAEDSDFRTGISFSGSGWETGAETGLTGLDSTGAT
jgi:hypothetical protein